MEARRARVSARELSLATFAASALLSCISRSAAPEPPPAAVRSWPPTFGVHLAHAWFPVAEGEMELLAAHGVGFVSQTPFASAEPHVPRIRMRTELRTLAPEEARLVELARRAREHGIATLLKPHLWLDRSWPGAVEMHSEADWQRWFEQYGRFLLRWARIAEEHQIEALCVGSELDPSLGHEAEWRALIAEVRTTYGGALTYNANWNRFQDVPFWDALDAIGVSAWFPLTDAARPSLDTLVALWQPIRARLAACAARWGRPVLFTEIGYLPIEGAFARPWEHNPGPRAPAPECQAAGYEAVTRVFSAEPWFAGALWWEWRLAEDPPPPWDRFPPTPLGAGYSPRTRPAEEVLRRMLRAGRASAGAER